MGVYGWCGVWALRHYITCIRHIQGVAKQHTSKQCVCVHLIVIYEFRVLHSWVTAHKTSAYWFWYCTRRVISWLFNPINSGLQEPIAMEPNSVSGGCCLDLRVIRGWDFTLASKQSSWTVSAGWSLNHTSHHCVLHAQSILNPNLLTLIHIHNYRQ